MDFLLILGRILFGGFFVMSGINHLKNLKAMTGYAMSKGVPSPSLAVAVSGLMILLGGLGVIFWQYVAISLTLIGVFLVLVTPKMHAFWSTNDPQSKMMEMIQFQKNMALLGATIMICILSGVSF